MTVETETALVTIKMTKDEAAVTRDALNAWADSRMKIARRRDRKERHLTGVSVEVSLADFFALCRAARGKVVDGLEELRR